MDAITNAIFDSCEPKITPSVAIQEVEGKAIIEVEILPGMPRSYYIKSQGILDGTYIRVSGTTRHAERYQLQELILEGQNRYYDCEPCEGLSVTSKDITRLCADMKAMALHNTLTDTEKAKVKDLTQNVLISWGAGREGRKCRPDQCLRTVDRAGTGVAYHSMCSFQGYRQSVFCRPQRI